MVLDEEQRAAVGRLLLRPCPEASAHALEVLVAGIESSIAAYLKRKDETANFRATHDELRDLWVLVAVDDPPVGLIRQRLRKLHPKSKAALERRAHWLWPKLFGCDPPVSDIVEWSQTAPAHDLLRLLRAAIPEGGMVVPGRRRPSGRRSAPRLEPVILGVVRGAPAPQPSNASGRPRDDLAVQLIAFLAVDWAQATGEMPKPGRSDRMPFGDLVHQVFGWLGLPDATGALRRYWQTYMASRTTPA